MSVELLLKARLRIGSPLEGIHRNFEFSANAADSECRSGVKPFDDPNARRLCSPSCDGCRLVFDPPWHSGLMSDAAKLLVRNLRIQVSYKEVFNDVSPIDNCFIVGCSRAIGQGGFAQYWRVS